MNSMPRVVMKLGMPKVSEMNPLSSPTTTHTRRAAAKHAQKGRPKCWASAQSTIGASPKTEPIDRSNSPAIIKSANPSAMIESSGKRPRMPRKF